MNYELIKEKLNEAFNSNTKLHLKLKNNTWRNGFIISIRTNFFIFKDDQNEEEESFFFLEVVDLNPYIKKEESGDGSKMSNM